jgi:hypothetical protein
MSGWWYIWLIRTIQPFRSCLEHIKVRLARAESLDPAEVVVAHVFTRVVRRCFLLGDDPRAEKKGQGREKGQRKRQRQRKSREKGSAEKKGQEPIWLTRQFGSV